MRGVSRFFLFLAVWVPMVSTLSIAAQSSPGTGPMVDEQETKQEWAVIEGKITYVEPDGTLIVQDQTSKSRIVYVRNKTRILRDGKDISRKDLTVGDSIVARVDPMRTALEIRLLDQKH